MTANNNRIIFDGKLHSADQPVASAASRGIMYGEGVFETFRTYKGHTLLFSGHYERLKKGCNFLGIDLKKALSQASIKIEVRKLLVVNELLEQDAIVRIQCWRDGSRGYLPQSPGQMHYCITASACPSFDDQRPTLATVSTKRIPSQSLPAWGKFTNGINYIIAAQEAEKQSADDALMQTVDEVISETTIANIFWIKGNYIFTPSVDCDLLPGITRRTVIQIIEGEEDLTILEDAFFMDRIYSADAVFVCNSVRELLPVGRIDDQNYPATHPVMGKICRLYRQYRDQKLKPLSNT